MKVAILDDYQNVALGLADWAALNAEITVFTEPFPTPDPDTVAAALAGHDVIVAMRERTRFPAELLERLTDLRLLVSTGHRNAAIDVPAAQRLGITVCGTGYFASPTIEHTWALILAAARNLPRETASMRAGGWQVSLGTGLHGKTLGLLGLGRIGAEVARIGQAFGMETIAWSQNLTPDKAEPFGVRAVTKDELFAEADFLTIHLVLSARTRGLVSAAELAGMKESAILVNTSRGPIVEEGALIEALRANRIRGAALDVYDTEPLPADHPLRALPNATLTGHIGYVTDELYKEFYTGAVENIVAFNAGNPIRVMG